MTIEERLKEINQKKTIRQGGIVKKWINNKYVGTLIAATGFGKTFTAVMAIIWLQNIRPNSRIVIVVPTLYLQDQWLKVLKANKVNLTYIKVQVINTACKLKQECDLLILDEVQLFASDEFGLIFENTKYKGIFCLTAEITRSDGREEIIKKYAPVIDIVSIEECLREEYVSKFRIYNIPITMTEQERKTYHSITKLYNYYEYLLGGNSRAWNMVNIILKAKKRLTDEEFDLLYNNEQFLAALKFKKVVGARKQFLNGLSGLLELTQKIFDKYPDRKAITFSESIDTVNKVYNLNPEISSIYHSRLKTTEKRDNIKRFIEDDSIKRLASAKALDTGMDIPGISLGIALSGTSKFGQALQRLGRTARFEIDKIALFFNPYLPGSQGEKWLRKRCQGLPNTYYINSLDEIII